MRTMQHPRQPDIEVTLAEAYDDRPPGLWTGWCDSPWCADAMHDETACTACSEHRPCAVLVLLMAEPHQHRRT